MAIPRARDDDVPPPLPPPRYIGEQLSEGPSQDVGWQWGNTHNTGFGSVKPGSSLFGRASISQPFQGPPRREPSASRSLDDSMSSDGVDNLSDEDRGKNRPTLANHR